MDARDVARIEEDIARSTSVAEFIRLDQEIEAAAATPERDGLREALERHTQGTMQTLLRGWLVEAQAGARDPARTTTVEQISRAAIMRAGGLELNGSEAFLRFLGIALSSVDREGAISEAERLFEAHQCLDEAEKMIAVIEVVRPDLFLESPGFHWCDVGLVLATTGRVLGMDHPRIGHMRDAVPYRP